MRAGSPSPPGRASVNRNSTPFFAPTIAGHGASASPHGFARRPCTAAHNAGISRFGANPCDARKRAFAYSTEHEMVSTIASPCSEFAPSGP
jgi:hypothetical protein